jgi:hypothetical protein
MFGGCSSYQNDTDAFLLGKEFKPAAAESEIKKVRHGQANQRGMRFPLANPGLAGHGGLPHP